ncbi:MAG: flagellar hook capping FlgD N-terminal domain-containing protein [Actinomycetota bacterium]
MTDTNVNAVAGSTVRPEWALPPEETAPTNELGKDEFLQLLVAQLKYQDPLEPQSSDEFIATTAQFTVVEKLDELTAQGENTQLINSLTTAGSLVGREVTASQNGIEVTAVVDRSTIRNGAVVLETEAGAISLEQIVSIGAPPAEAAASTTASTTTGVLTPVAVPVVPTVATTPAPSTDDDAESAAVDEADTESGSGLG